MANLAQTLKSEIARLARKEVRQETAALRKAATQYRGDIAELKRQVKEQLRRLVYLESQEKKRVNSAVPKEEIGRARFTAKGLKSHREKLGCSAADYASLVGVSAQSIYHWESEKSTPRKSQLPALVTVRKLGVREARRRLELM